MNEASFKDQLKKQVQSIDEVIKEYEKLGKVSVGSKLFDDNGNLQSFTVNLERVQGLIEKIKYTANEFKDNGETSPIGYGLQNITELDKTEQEIQKIVKAENDLANAMAKGREQAELQAKAEQARNDALQNKAINQALEEQYAEQQKEVSRVQGLGQYQSTLDPNLLSKSTDEIKKYVQGLYDVNTEVTKVQKSTDGLGNTTATATVKTKLSNDEIREEKLVLDQTTNSVYKQSEALKEVDSHTMSFGDHLKMAFTSIASFATITAAFYGTIQQIKDGIQFINDLNKAQTNIQMITGMNKTEVGNLTKEYSNLAAQLHETTSGVMEASEEFLRAGNSEKETSDLLKASTVMSKIAGQSQQDSAQSLIAIMNSYHMQASDMLAVVDKMVAVDNTAATSTAELSAAIQKTASSAQASGVSLTQLISWIGTISSVTRQSAKKNWRLN